MVSEVARPWGRGRSGDCDLGLTEQERPCVGATVWVHYQQLRCFNGSNCNTKRLRFRGPSSGQFPTVVRNELQNPPPPAPKKQKHINRNFPRLSRDFGGDFVDVLFLPII